MPCRDAAYEQQDKEIDDNCCDYYHCKKKDIDLERPFSRNGRDGIETIVLSPLVINKVVAYLDF
jgi:hypothetical protein